tara:strand:+ start:139 stop:657 length:519 start_codon:yes stop_codon:yes gene_type:complete
LSVKFTVLILGLALSSFIGCSQPEPGLEIEVFAELRDAGRLASLEFEILDVQVQPEGYEVTADHQVTPEWIGLEKRVESFDVCDVTSGPLTIAQARIPAGRYDRIFLRPSSLVGTTHSGEQVFIENVMEPTAFPLEVVEDQAHVLRLEVIVLESLDASRKLSIFAKNVEQVD